jgi:lipoyl(octanoyl) transferase
MKQTVSFQDLGTMDYKTAWDYQESLLRANVEVKSEAKSKPGLSLSPASATDGSKSENRNPLLDDSGGEAKFESPDVTSALLDSELQTQNYLLFVEHPPVFTLGKNGSMNNVLMSEDTLRERGIEFFRTNRGGDITFHGPQQIVGYPILDLEKFDTDIGHYLRNLEQVIILTLDDYGIAAGRSPGETGVWIDAGIKGKERKICAIGVRCSRWITMHGFAFNVNTDLSYFNLIIPCGIQNKQVTSLKKELGKHMDMEDVKGKVKSNFEKVFDVNLVDFGA